ncbi:glycoside hydrolase family 92 protein [Granulicella sp. WH15]|uniref:GH92 family glycosyl hydrolase n=1 Tax=Granulicella sp. WH15 TaxID=2602070 RepID=UPI001366C646|nr:GH92 family glycosyl hydrolase [Granulicella sp. WH15]QHN05109.1 glycoside hydrolase family 92 protein [Granulicella sp. WH15]
MQVTLGISLLLGISMSIFSAAQTPTAANSVNLLIGTAGDGMTFPAVGVPFGMTQWTPQTREGERKCVAPYYAVDARIQGFRASHFLSGSCMQDYGSVTLMPLSGPLKVDPKERASAFLRESEVIHPSSYSVDLKDYGIHVDMTGSLRSGFLRFRFNQGGKSWILVQDNARPGDGDILIDEAHQEISGRNAVRRLYAGRGKLAGFSGYFVAKFDRPFHVGGTWSGDVKHEGSLSQQAVAGAPGAYIYFDLKPGDVVQSKIGTSFTSVDEARKNLHAEIRGWSFNRVEAQARSKWSDALEHVQITADATDRTIFYTALYHASLLPRTFSDVSGSYPRFAGMGELEQAKGFTYYDDFSIWDTFRAVHPLLTILDPKRESDMVRSLIAKGDEGGFLPIFPAWNSYTQEMVGDHAGAIISDAYFKGIRGFDVKDAYRLMRKNALESPASEALYSDGRGRRALQSYLKYGYIPLEDKVPFAFHGEEQVSRTLEYAYDDAQVSAMAAALGHDEDAELFRKRAQNYHNVLDPETGFVRGRHVDGTWDKPFDPAGKYHYITEGLPFQYTFFVPQDVDGLIAALHGRKAFVDKLDALFDGGYYDHGNEPSHHIAYLYDYAGEAWKTQAHVHKIMDEGYHNGPIGLAGNDDAGQMSAWYVFSALGFYPVSPGTPRYSIGTPRFEDATIHLPGGKQFHIHANGAHDGKFFIHAAKLNGVPLTRNWITHAEIAAGGELVFDMSSEANPEWPAAVE